MLVANLDISYLAFSRFVSIKMNRLCFKIIVFFATTSLFSLVDAEVLFERGSTWKYLKGSRSSVDWRFSWQVILRL